MLIKTSFFVTPNVVWKRSSIHPPLPLGGGGSLEKDPLGGHEDMASGAQLLHKHRAGWAGTAARGSVGVPPKRSKKVQKTSKIVSVCLG